MAKKINTLITEMECAENMLNFIIDEKSLLLDIKALIKDYYAATFSLGEDSLELTFNNGQKFNISVWEIKN